MFLSDKQLVAVFKSNRNEANAHMNEDSHPGSDTRFFRSCTGSGWTKAFTGTSQTQPGPTATAALLALSSRPWINPLRR